MENQDLNVLFVLTSHDELGNTGLKTGFWVEEFAAPYYALADAGVQISIASPKGGQPPIDPKSALPDFQTEATKRFDADQALQEKLAHSLPLHTLKQQDYDAIFYPGGHGPLWDLTNDQASISLIEDFWNSGKPVAAVCHAPGALRFVKDSDGKPLVQGKKVTGFSNTEEAAVELTDVVPFLVEDELKNLGADYSKGADWSSYVLQDGKLITGQNPASSEETAKALLALLQTT
ncbi:type 1 glutamine amidotransferase domain-containing protein [Sphingobacterium bambusae]|uniref:Type 1 glutamine amidotransferase domain-containing protein n=1 Tax=Sphingobacterium bambusae TaxID=662858 RepID=A0ABW6BF97_9SPHI|nr:type 1 glutamine amidotransferase domain-containing protein [Sphingobacterium bambusae]WPL49524.1 type 1 glutamine amidotransferase domain-containing protein [Sphingobacterium bambusae]